MTKVKRRSHFAAIPNAAMRDEDLSIEARGLLALMMGMGDNWTFHANDLMKRCNSGKDKYQRMIRELKVCGYLEVSKKQGDDGRLGAYEYVIHDTTEGRENRQPGKPAAEKPGHLRIPTSKNTNNKTPNPKGDDLFSAEPEGSEPEQLHVAMDAGFKEFWDDIWPSHSRKAGSYDCRQVYESACLGKHKKADKIAPAELNRCARVFIASVKDMNFLPGPLPWLRKPGWEPFLGIGAEYSIEDLSKSQRSMLSDGITPPSMLVDGQPNAQAKYWLEQFGHTAKRGRGA